MIVFSVWKLQLLLHQMLDVACIRCLNNCLRCLTFFGMHSFFPFIHQEDVVPVTVEKCLKQNVYQHWKCIQVKDGSSSRLLALRTLKSGGYLSTIAYDYAYWSRLDTVFPVVTGI